MGKRLLSKNSYLAGIPGSPPRTMRRRKKPSVLGKESEASIQKFAEELLDRLGIKFLRIPDEVYRMMFATSSRVGIGSRIRAAEYLKGFPDLVLLKPLGDKYNLAHILELKREGGKLRVSQKNFLGGLNYRVPRSCEEVEKEILEFYKEKLNGI